MTLQFRELVSADRELLADWLSSDSWPFHGQPNPSHESVLAGFDNGQYSNEETKTFWILQDSQPVGLLRLFELGDLTPRFDLRIGSANRGQGLGREALNWLTQYVFSTQPDARRLEGQTREDNHAMQHLFVSCGYVKEAHYREAWPTPDGRFLDAVGFAILRSDWHPA